MSLDIPTATSTPTTPTMAPSKDNNSPLKVAIVAFSVISMYHLFSKKGYIWFSWHFISMITGFVLLPGLAFVIKKAGGYTNTKNHGYLMALATLMTLFGFYVIYSNKTAFGKDHFTTTHGQLGLVATLAYLVMAIFSFPALNVDWGVFKTNKTIRFGHKWSGRVSTAIAWICCIYGFNTVVTDLTSQILFAAPLAVFAYFVLL